MPRSDKGTVRATERDMELIRWIAEQYAIPLDQLAQLIRASEHAARRLMQRWKQAGWAEGRVLIVRERPIIWVTQRGQDDMGLDFRQWQPTLAKLEHIRAVNSVRLQLEQSRPEGIWTSERQLLKHQAQRQREAREKGLEPPKAHHLADAVWQITPDAEKTAIEVERTYKGTERTTQIMLHLVNVQRFPKVAYFTTRTIKPHLEAIVQSRPDLSAKVRIYELQEQDT